MPKFLEKKLKKQYGEKSDIPYKIMNKMGFMRGSKVTAKGKAAEKKHEADMPRRKGPSEEERERFGKGVSRGMGRGARRGFARGMRVAREKLQGLGGDTKRKKSIRPKSSFAAALNRRS